MEFEPAGTDALLTEKTFSWLELSSLPTVLLTSMGGMLCFRLSQRITFLLMGYALEAVAFFAYPFAIRVYSLRIVFTIWSASSAITALVADISLGETSFRVEHVLGFVFFANGVYMLAS